MGAIMGRANKMWDKLKTEGAEKRILVLGLDAAGKTTILYKMKVKNFFNGTTTSKGRKRLDTTPTIGFNVESVEPIKGVSFIMWDIGGQNVVRQLWKHYCTDTAGLLFVVDSSDRDRLWEARHELHRIMDEDKMDGVPCVVIANKQDMPESMKPCELESGLDLQRLTPNHNWHIQPTCAISGEGVIEAITTLARLIKLQEKDAVT